VENETVANALLKEIKVQVDTKSQSSLDKMDGKRSVFFVGAGASVESGLPNFRQFSEHMLSNLLPKDHGISMVDISMFVSELRPEVLLQTLQEVFGERIFDFYDWFDDAEPSTNHFVLARVIREGGLVLTTNVDNLIETAYGQLYGERDFDFLVTREDFENFSVSEMDASKGVLMKFHGTVDENKTGLARYETVRFLLDQVGEGILGGMHRVLTDVVQNFDMIYLGYSGCDNFSVQPVLCNVDTDQTTLWLWYEWKEQMILEDSGDIFEKDMNEVGAMVSHGKSFSEINRGMEILSTCEILKERKNAIRLRGNISTIMGAIAHPDDSIAVEGLSAQGPVPAWVKNTSRIDRMRCAAKLYSRANCTDEGIKCLEEANRLANSKSDKFLKAQITKELGSEYANASTADSYKKALGCYDIALKIFEEMEITSSVMDTILNIVNVLRRTRRFDEAQKLLDELEASIKNNETETFVTKIKVRKGLMLGLILGMGRGDKESRDKALPILEEAAEQADEGGFVRLRAAVLNASGLIKYQMAGDSIEMLESGAKDLDAAFRLNIYIGDARSCFQQMRNVGLIHAKLSRLTNRPELLEQAIAEFRRGETFLFRLSKNAILGELLEIRFRLGESLVDAARFDEAETILSKVREERVTLGDWHNEARTLELLLKASVNDPENLITRANQVKAIYEDAKSNKTKKARFKNQAITASNGRQILTTASDMLSREDPQLSVELQKLAIELFGDKA